MTLTVQRGSGLGISTTNPYNLALSAKKRREAIEQKEAKGLSHTDNHRPKGPLKPKNIFNFLLLLTMLALTGKAVNITQNKKESKGLPRHSLTYNMQDKEPALSHNNLLNIYPSSISTDLNRQYIAKPGVNPVVYKDMTYSGLKASVLEVDLNNSNIKVKPVLAWDKVGRIETVTSMVKRHNAIGGINAGFYDYSSTNLPIGFIMIDRKVVASNMGDWNRAIITIDENNKAQIIRPEDRPRLRIKVNENKTFIANGVNRPRYYNSIIVFTPEYGSTTKTRNNGTEIVVEHNSVTKTNYNQGNSEIPKDGYVISLDGDLRKAAENFKVGDKVEQTVNLPKNIKHAILAGPSLIKDGIVNVTLKEEGFNPNISYSTARAAVGVTQDNKLIFIRASSSKSTSLYPVAKLLLKLGAVDAMAFDGGGSSSLIYKGKGISRRSVSNAILVWEKIS